MTSSYQLTDADILRIINNTPIFSGVDFSEQRLIASKCSILEVNANEIVIRQGDIGDQLYVIISGQVSVTREIQPSKKVTLATLGPGDVFGEIAILRDIPRTAFITTLKPCKFLTIDGHSFLKIYEQFSAHSRDNIQLIVEKRLIQQKRGGVV